MSNRNMSDMIESYLKRTLKKEGQIEIQRNEIAELFDCVPSQINYVINSRFTVQHGYAVESKRGGGGYIRIIKIQVNDNAESLQRIEETIGRKLSEKEAETIVNTLYQNNLMTSREGQIMLAAIDQKNYELNEKKAQEIRANILSSMVKLLILRNN
ncbi:MAG: CtsR family transcriptional regulator [Atopostipes sp.]|nr:CtsR family transcriptional regulator [Atopostipes sp.]MDN6670292.1 CtsR family transcriptional regulator [Tetragenococcus koreensis]